MGRQGACGNVMSVTNAGTEVLVADGMGVEKTQTSRLKVIFFEKVDFSNWICSAFVHLVHECCLSPVVV